MRVVKEGREHGQAVAYLDDGTMVVVEKAAERIGSQVEVRVTNVIQTTTGRMIFAALNGAGPAPERRSRSAMLRRWTRVVRRT